ncbi:hypothetical protein ACFOZ7_14175 [Natribaculum luteum]|uniref:DUF4397 domain-containing protein n=1 Tax=Natribaculum luteum TaxID=1586232 RepID=A0ABD5P221_9EURY|nr:hypothetical protein [Natribaculum luteum]
MTRDTSQISRRTALQTVVGAALVSGAGCLSSDENTTTNGKTPIDSQGVLQRVAVDGTALVVELAADADVDQINLIQPSGELFGQRNVAAGAQQVSFELGTSYTPGEYSVVALSGDETVIETPFSIEPNLRIIEMGIGRNHPQKMWSGAEDEISEEAFVSVENQGSGPDALTKLLFLGDVPYPSDKQGTNYASNDDISGIYDPESDSEVDEIVIAPEEQIRIYSSRSPFAFVPGAGTSCIDEQQTGEFEVVVKTRVSSDNISEIYNIQYSASEEPDNCEIFISEA